jgi:hypothetical protein
MTAKSREKLAASQSHLLTIVDVVHVVVLGGRWNENKPSGPDIKIDANLSRVYLHCVGRASSLGSYDYGRALSAKDDNYALNRFSCDLRNHTHREPLEDTCSVFAVVVMVSQVPVVELGTLNTSES